MKILVIEDEESAARQLMSLLNECIHQPEYLGIIDSVEDAIDCLRTQPPADLIFADIYLSDGASFEIFNTIPTDIPIIFTTAYDQYAIQAFEVNSIDYLLKPIRKEKLQKALEKYTRLQNRPGGVINERLLENIQRLMFTKEQYKQHFLVPYKDRLIPVTAHEFAWFEIKNGVVRGITFDQKHWLMEESLDKLTEILNPTEFYRANRQFLINRKAIKEIEHYFNGRFCLHLSPQPDEPVLVSKANAGKFRKWMTDLINQ
jgi:two-component system LytT family response regulator